MVLCTLQRSPASEYSVLVLTPRGDRVPSSCRRRARSQCVVGARGGTVARFTHHGRTFAPGDVTSLVRGHVLAYFLTARLLVKSVPRPARPASLVSMISVSLKRCTLTFTQATGHRGTGPMSDSIRPTAPRGVQGFYRYETAAWAADETRRARGFTGVVAT